MLTPAAIRREIAYHVKCQKSLEKLLVLYGGKSEVGKTAAKPRKSSPKRDGVKGIEGNLAIAETIMKEAGVPLKTDELLKRMHAKGSGIETSGTLRSYFRASPSRFEKIKHGFWQLKAAA